MLVSELIKELEELFDREGDIFVTIESDSINTYSFEIESVYCEDNKIYLYGNPTTMD